MTHPLNTWHNLSIHNPPSQYITHPLNTNQYIHTTTHPFNIYYDTYDNMPSHSIHTTTYPLILCSFGWTFFFINIIIIIIIIILSGGGVIGAPGRNASRSILNDLHKWITLSLSLHGLFICPMGYLFAPPCMSKYVIIISLLWYAMLCDGTIIQYVSCCIPCIIQGS